MAAAELQVRWSRWLRVMWWRPYFSDTNIHCRFFFFFLIKGNDLTSATSTTELCNLDLKTAQMSFLGGGSYTPAGKCSQLVDWYPNNSDNSSSSLAPAQLHARLAAQPPPVSSILHLRCTVARRDLTVFVACLLCEMYLPQTRRWSCGKSVRGTSVQRATTWRMRMDGSEAHQPSPH